ATIQLPATTPYNFVSLTERSGDFAVKYLNSKLYDAFVSTGDTARISSYFTKKSAASGSNFSFDNYGGMPLLIDATADQANNASNFNNSFRSGSNPFLTRARIISYSEQEFILAEAALKGYISGDPAMYYSKGVEGAYAEIGLDAGTASSYLHHTGVAFDQSSMGASLRQIITQKWMANINNGFEGWIEYRRTGYPVFQTGGSASLNNNQIPSRFLYPTSESTINADNYKMEMQQMGGKETTNYKAWWEK
ncbi:MAG TPA: SusD/RagB family nutrient-binding outer membrane lipoprotein, partial [Chitinophagaceae bacterium]|nr:SusD/RagB family nutrient-binding outer membrane lipoprotein [Chitinophagaceae bacterium]